MRRARCGRVCLIAAKFRRARWKKASGRLEVCDLYCTVNRLMVYTLYCNGMTAKRFVANYSGHSVRHGWK